VKQNFFLKINEEAKIVADNSPQLQATLYAIFSPENSLWSKSQSNEIYDYKCQTKA
jgi:hypothetical protein